MVAQTPFAAMTASQANTNQLILGEATRTIDARFRLSLPPEMAVLLAAEKGDCILAKERPGCLSLWNAATWQTRLDEGVGVVVSKIVARRLDTQTGPGSATRPIAVDTAPTGATGRPRPIGGAGRVSRVFGRGGRRDGDGHRRRRVRRNLAP